MNNADRTAPMSRQVGTLTLTVWPDSPLGEHQRYAYRIEDTATGQTIDGRDLFTGAGAPVAPARALRDLAAYLPATGAARQYATDNPGSGPEHESLFPGWVAEAARQNADALALLAEGEPPEPSRRSAPTPSWFEHRSGNTTAQTLGRSL
jgi:hypothetical protein